MKNTKVCYNGVDISTAAVYVIAKLGARRPITEQCSLGVTVLAAMLYACLVNLCMVRITITDRVTVIVSRTTKRREYPYVFLFPFR